MAPPSKILFSAEDLRINRDVEIFTETYFVTLGYSLDDRSSACSPMTDNSAGAVSEELDLIIPTNAVLGRWFHVTTSPIFRIRRRRRHTFHGGLPLYYGRSGTVTSVYVAIMEGDKRARQAATAVREAINDLPMEGMFKAIGDLASSSAPQVGLIKQAFGLVVKVIEQALLNNRDDIQYTNVFTFKESNDYLRGFLDAGNHKVSLTVSAETA